MSTRKKLIIFIISLLVIDQVVKIWIKTHMMIGDEFSVFGDWFKITGWPSGWNSEVASGEKPF